MNRSHHKIAELTEEEIRQLIREKLRTTRHNRLERFRKTGRAIILVPDAEPGNMGLLRTEVLGQEGTPDSHRHQLLSWGKRLLTVVEVLMVLIFLAAFSSLFRQLQSLNREAVSAWEMPVLSPTPLIQAVVLPSGHTPPDAQGRTRPNEAEIPLHLRPMVQSQSKVPVVLPTPGPGHGIRIQIPAIGVDAPVIQGDGWEQLKKGVAQRLGTANPGENGNMVLSGHNDVFGEVFRDLDQLKPGDEIILFTSQQTYRYIITGWTLVEPTQVDVMNPTPDPTLTLISCYPYLIDTERIIVKAVLS